MFTFQLVSVSFINSNPFFTSAFISFTWAIVWTDHASVRFIAKAYEWKNGKCDEAYRLANNNIYNWWYRNKRLLFTCCMLSTSLYHSNEPQPGSFIWTEKIKNVYWLTLLLSFYCIEMHTCKTLKCRFWWRLSNDILFQTQINISHERTACTGTIYSIT